MGSLKIIESPAWPFSTDVIIKDVVSAEKVERDSVRSQINGKCYGDPSEEPFAPLGGNSIAYFYPKIGPKT